MSDLNLVILVSESTVYSRMYKTIPRIGEKVDIHSKYLNEPDERFKVISVINDPSPRTLKKLLRIIVEENDPREVTWKSIFFDENPVAILGIEKS